MSNIPLFYLFGEVGRQILLTWGVRSKFSFMMRMAMLSWFPALVLSSKSFLEFRSRGNSGWILGHNSIKILKLGCKTGCKTWTRSWTTLVQSISVIRPAFLEGENWPYKQIGPVSSTHIQCLLIEKLTWQWLNIKFRPCNRLKVKLTIRYCTYLG